MSKIIHFFLDLLFPVSCLHCGLPGRYLCKDGWANFRLQLTHPAILREVQYCDKVFVRETSHHFLLTTLIHYFKYRYITDLSFYIAPLLIEQLTEMGVSNIDVVVSVPLSKKRLRWRGYNQSEILAQAIGQHFGWPVNTNDLIRKVHTRPQVGLNAQQRQKNVKGIFGLKDFTPFDGKNILLVDDVLTTGATLSQCAKMLKLAGAAEVYGLVLTTSG